MGCKAFLKRWVTYRNTLALSLAGTFVGIVLIVGGLGAATHYCFQVWGGSATH